LEQHRRELSVGEPQQEQPVEPQQQQRLSRLPEFRWHASAVSECPDGTDRFPVQMQMIASGKIIKRAVLCW
jgi:hypothetical protein